MPGRLLGFRKSSPNSSLVDVSVKKRDSFHAHRVHTTGRSPSPSRQQKRRSSNIDLFPLTGRRHSRDHSDVKSAKPTTPPEPHRTAQLGLLVESPPLVLFHTPDNSTGALFSGQFTLDVKEETVTITSFVARFASTTTQKKPLVERCTGCTSQTNELKKWDFLTEPIRAQSSLVLHRGEHKFPFTYLVPGHLPATTHGIDAVLDYHVTAEALTSTGEKLTFGKSVVVKRAILPGPDKHSVRIFPPTNLTTQVTLPSVIYPIGEFNVAMRMAGISTRKTDCTLRWKLRRLIWRIEETQRVTPPACAAHAHKITADEPASEHIETRDVGGGEVKTGWKTNLDDDTIEIEFNAHVDPSTKPLCNMTAPGGMSVKHNLIVEMVVAEEWSAKKKPNSSTPTGAARVLRTQFGLTLTERSGMGIAWDDEQPPTYEDVPASPPTYVVATADEISDIEDGMCHMDIESPAYYE